jgi:hypothetical protein
VGQLIQRTETEWHEQRWQSTVADDAEQEEPRIGGEKRSALVPRVPYQGVVVDAFLPRGIVTGGTEPTGQTAQHGITGEPWVGTIGHGRIK